MVGRQLHAKAVGIRPGQHYCTGPAAAWQAGHVRAIRPRRMARRAHSRRRGPAARRRRAPDATAESCTRGACLAVRTPVARQWAPAISLDALKLAMDIEQLALQSLVQPL